MRKKYTVFIFIMAVCCYCVAVLRYLCDPSDADMSWRGANIHTTCLTQTQKNVRQTHASPAYSNGAAHSGDVPIVQSVSSTLFRSTGGVVASCPAESFSVGHSSSGTVLSSPTLAQNTRHCYATSSARLHSYGAQGSSGGGVAGGSRSRKTSSPSTGGAVSVSGFAGISPLRGNSSYHGFTTVASELNGTTLADATDGQDISPRPLKSPGVPGIAPVGDAVMPLLLLMAIYIGVKKKRLPN